MAVISVEVPDTIAKRFKPFTVVQYEAFLELENMTACDFEEEHIDQKEFLQYLEEKHG